MRTPSNNLFECTSNSRRAQSGSPAHDSNSTLKTGIHSPRHNRSRSERLLDHVPNLTSGIDDYPKHRHRQSRATPRNRFKGPHIPNNKLRPIERHLPPLPSCHSRLLANIRHHTRKFFQPRTAFTNASISLLLPTQNGVR